MRGSLIHDAFYDLMRLWNTLALLFPERCDDILVYPVGELPKAMPNDLRLTEALETLKERPLDNLPEELRSTGYQGHRKEEEAKRELKKEKAIQRQIEGTDKVQSNPPNPKPPTEPEPELPKEDDKDVNIPSHAKDAKVKVMSGRGKKIK